MKRQAQYLVAGLVFVLPGAVIWLGQTGAADFEAGNQAGWTTESFVENGPVCPDSCIQLAEGQDGESEGIALAAAKAAAVGGAQGAVDAFPWLTRLMAWVGLSDLHLPRPLCRGRSGQLST